MVRLAKRTALILALAFLSACASSPGALPEDGRISIVTGVNMCDSRTIPDKVYFDADRSELNEASRAILDEQISLLKTGWKITVTIEGHADERGTREYNFALGERRANAVRSYMIALGITPDRIKITSYGKEKPAAEGSNEAAWAQNRRATTVVD